MLAGDWIGSLFGTFVKHAGSFDQFLSMGHGGTSTRVHMLLGMVKIWLVQIRHGYLMFGRCSNWLVWLAADRDEAAMAQEFSRRSIAGFAVTVVVATVLTVMGTFYVLHRFVLDNPADPLTRAGGLPSDRNAK